MKRNKDVIILYVIIVGLLMIGDESIRNVIKEWIMNLNLSNLSTIGTFLSAFATAFMAYFAYRNLDTSRNQTEATQKQVEKLTEQLKQRWRAVPTFINPPLIAFNEFSCKGSNNQIIEGVPEFLKDD